MLALSIPLWLWWAAGISVLLMGTVFLVRWATTDHLIAHTFRSAAEGDFEAAAARLQAAAEKNDPRGQRCEALGFLYFQRNRWNEAADAFARAAQRNPTRLTARIYQAHSLTRAGRVDEGRELLQAMSQERPEDIMPLCGMALAMVDIGDTGAAAEYYWKARRLFEQHPSVQSHEAVGLLEAAADAVGNATVASAKPSEP
jgi:tetratricopeptide (TPR) repeat protein